MVRFPIDSEGGLFNIIFHSMCGESQEVKITACVAAENWFDDTSVHSRIAPEK